MYQEQLKKIKRGNKNSFKELYEYYYNPVCSFGLKYIKEITIIEDLIQETFIKVWEIRNNFDTLEALKSFLYTSIKNKSLNYLKHQSVISKHEKNIVTELESQQYFSNSIIEEETFNLLYTQVNNLPESSKKIMLLALNGLKNKEIAEELSISENTVKTQKKIAYKKLKISLNDKLFLFLLSFI